MIVRFGNVVAVVCIVIGCLTTSVDALQKRCTSGQNPGELLLEIRESVGAISQQILSYGSGYNPGCVSSIIQVQNGTNMLDILSLDIVYDYNNIVQVTPDPAVDDCFVEAGGTSTEYTVNVVVQEQVGAIQVTDKFYTVSCNVNDLDAGLIDVTAVDVSLANISPSIPPNLQETFDIKLVDENNLPLTEVQLGDSVYLFMTYTKPNTQLGEWPIGVHNYLLTVHHDRTQPTGEVTLIDENGCSTYLTDENVAPFELTSSFKWLGTNDIVNEYYFKTGAFKIALLEGGNQLMFRGYYRAECYSMQENKCFDQDLYCASLQDRRRRSEQRTVNGTYDLSVTVKPPGSNDQVTLSDGECSRDMFLIVAIVLAVLLLVVTMLSLTLLYKLYVQRDTRSNSKIRQTS